MYPPGGSGSPVETDFIFNPHGSGWQVDRVALESACIDTAQRAGVRSVRGVTVQSLSRVGSRWQLEVPDERLTSSWLIDATGSGASIARSLGVRRFPIDRLVSVYMRAPRCGCDDPDSRTLIEATQSGWWYTALTPSGHRTIAFQTDVDLVRGAKWQSHEWFLIELQRTQCVQPLLLSNGYESASSITLVSARSCRLQQFCGSAWLAIGDAAMAFDPLSGQGMLKAIEGGKLAAETLIAGSKGALRGYAEEMEDGWRIYLRNRRANYAAERRWSDSPFWSRRHSNTDV